jgi:protein-disulfide isomerase
MTDNRRSLTGFHHAAATGARIIPIAVAMLLGACMTPASAPETVSEPATAESGQRTGQASGIASRDSAVSIIRMTPPTVALAGSHRIGSSRATVAVVEYSDYQCPYCREFYDQVYPRLKKEYVETGIVQFVHKDLPLTSIHPQALPAALAASCAGQQKRFWPMHDALYANHGALSPELYHRLAHEFGLDEPKFRVCLADSSREQFVMRDTAEALRLGINGTPSFVLGRIEGDELSVAHLFRGAPGYEAFAQVIDKLLKPERAGATPGTK